MPLLGAHLSIAGGFYKAVEAAAALDMQTVQIFTHSPSQWAVQPIAAEGKKSPRGKAAPAEFPWRGKPIADDAAQRFHAAMGEHRLSRALSHSSYLINLAAPDEMLWRRSVAAFVEELRRAEALHIHYVVLHPGAFTTSDEAAGIRAVIRALDEVHVQTAGLAAQCLLETTAGQGTCLGCRFEQLAAILDGVKAPDRVGVCLDTCHVFAAGYPLGTEREYRKTFREFDQTVGVSKIAAFHLNDSKRELGSRVDRHEHIGRGHLGLEPFRFLLNDARFQNMPMYLETPKGNHAGRPWDAINLETLRGLISD